MQNFTSVILYMNIAVIAVWLSAANFKFDAVPVCLHDNTISLYSKHVLIFILPQKHDVISELRHSYA